VATTYFNWEEIYLKSRKDVAAIIILAFAETKLYDRLSSRTLLRLLNINHVPPFLFREGLLEQTKVGIIFKYSTQEPISYFKNSSFLFTAVSAKYKANYLKAISMRRLSDTSSKIPREYFDKVSYNPFLKIDDDFIYFTPESRFEIS